jgi:hypothetical protein
MKNVSMWYQKKPIPHRALQFIPAPTGPWVVREKKLLANERMLLAIIRTILSPICIYLYIIINALNVAEDTSLRNGFFLIPH